MSTRARRLAAAAVTTALLGLAGACSSGGGDAGGSAGGSSDSAVSTDVSELAGSSAAAPPAKEGAGAARDVADAPNAAMDSLDYATGAAASAPVATPVRAPEVQPLQPRSLIKEGNVALRSDDVARTLFDVRKVLQRTGGEVAEDSTEADDEGEAERALLTVRVPVARFDLALEDLKALGTAQDGVDLIDSSSSSTDVSTQVIDTAVRVRLQRRSIERISILLDRATSIRDIVSIERELARREADLGSLEKRQSFLADQTSMSTITISLERPEPVTPKKKSVTPKDETGFVAGLQNGWDAFRTVTTGLLTAVGALLPFGIVLLLVGVPLRLWLRRRQPHPAATA